MAPSSPILNAARGAYKAGLSVVPPCEDGTKRPVAEWKRFQSERPDAAQMKAWYGPCAGIGAITGCISGNLEVFDFDDRPTYDAFVELAAQAGLGELVAKVEAGYCEDTPKGGVHWLYRCEDVSGNLKLAKRQAGAEVKTLIETRGEGGYIVLAPSNGKVHDTGKPYVLRSGGFGSIVTLTPADRLELLSLARSFDEMPSKEKPTNVRAGTTQVTDRAGVKAGDDYRERAAWPEILEPAGWVQVFTRGDVTHWRRPGKTRGTSATTNVHGSNLLYVFSGSTPFEAERGYNKFAAYTILNHGGDFSAAAVELVLRGFGAPAWTPQDEREPPVDPQTADSLMEPLKTVLGRVLDDLQNDTPPKVCATPYPSLNNFLNGGFSPGELIYLGARPGVGKSSIGLDMARTASRTGPVLIISREMVNASLARRMMGQEGRINAARMKRKTLSEIEDRKVLTVATELGDRPIWLSDRAISAEEIAALCEKPPAGPWALVIVDYLQLIRAPKHIKEHRLALEHVSQELKQLAIRYAMPVLCLSSLSRLKDEGEPSLSNLRDSGELEHDADVVLLLHRKSDTDTTVQCRIAKNRDGGLGSFSLLFLSDFVTFVELDERTK